MVVESSDALLYTSPMVTLGTSRVVNRTQYQRTFTITTVIPVPDAPIWSPTEINSGSPPVTVSGADIVPGTKRCQTYIQGERYINGRPKYIRVVFKGEIEAGVFDVNYPYAYYKEKIVTFTSDVTAPVAYNIIGAVVTGLAATNFTVSIPYVAPEGSKQLVFSIANLLGFETEVEGAGNGPNQIIKSFLGGNRTVLSSIQYPSIWVDVMFELGAGMRTVKWWVIIGNSRYTALGNSYDRTDYAFPSNLEIFINHPIGEIVTVFGDAVKYPSSPASNGPGQTKVQVLAPPGPPRITDLSFPDGICTYASGTITYSSGANATELDTIAADKLDEVEIISLNWGDYNNFGLFGALPPRPNNSLVTSDLVGRYQAAKQFNQNWLDAQGLRHPWYQPKFGDASQYHAGNTDEYGVSRGWVFARSGQPDFRRFRLDVYQELCHPQHHKEGSPSTKFVTPQSKTGKSGLWSDLYFWIGRVFFGNNPYPATVKPTYGDPMSKREHGIASPPLNNFNERWDEHDRQHYEINWLTIHGMLTGDRLTRYIINSVEQNLLSTAWPVYDGRELESQTITQTNVSRAEGRLLKSLSQCYQVTGNTLAVTNIISRATNVLLHPVAGWVGQYSNFTVKPLYIGHSAQKTGLAGPASTNINAQCWKPWEEALVFYGVYGAYLITGNATLLDIAKKIASTVMIYGTRNNGGTGGSGGLRQDAYGMIWEPYAPNTVYVGNSGGQPVQAAQLYGNPLVNFQGNYFGSWPSQTTDDLWGLAIQAYEWALQTGDAQLQLVSFEFLRDTVVNEETRKGPYGWGNVYTNNVVDWSAIINDPFKTRQGGGSGTVGATVQITGISSMSVIPQVKGPVYVNATITSISSIGAAGFVTGVNIVYVNATMTSTSSMSVIPDIVEVGAIVVIGNSSDMIVVPEVVSISLSSPSRTELSGDFKYTTKHLVTDQGGRMVRVNQVFQIWAGDTHILEFLIDDENGNPLDLSIATDIIWKLANDAGSTPLISKSMNNGIYILPQSVEVTKGKMQILLSPVDTALLNGKFYHEGVIQFGSGLVTMFIGAGIVQPSLVK